MSSMKDTLLRNPEQLGRAVRVKRLEKGLSQVALAAQLGVERKWVIHLEAGNPRAELGLVLRVLGALDLQASLNDRGHSPAQASSNTPSRLDEVFQLLQRNPAK
jgi:HTH-type transcriptional regulator/antitoxin HipB